MSSPLPYFKFWQKEWLASSGTRRISLAARGLFIDLLAFQWEDGFIPDDVGEIAAMVGCSRKAVEKVWDQVSPSFPIISDKKRAHLRLLEDRDAAFNKMKKNAQNGSLGGSKRQANARANAIPNAIANGEPNGIANDKRNSSHTIAIYTSTNVDGENSPDSPFGKASAVLEKVNTALGWDAPTVTDIRRNLKPECPIQVLVKTYGIDGAADLFVWAYRNWTKKPTWPSVFDQRNQIREQMQGKSGPPLQVVSAEDLARAAE